MNSDDILSLMKIDRSYGIPFIKRFVKISLDEEKIKEYINSNGTNAIFYLLINSIKYKLEQSDLAEVGTKIGMSEKFEITFSTYNDLLDKVIDLIINALNELVDESIFNLLKEIYYLKIAKNKEDPLKELNNETLNTFKKFISADTYMFDDISLESINSLYYDNFKNEFELIKKIIKNVAYLIYGDISFELAKNSTNQLSEIINKEKIMLKESAKKHIEIKENTSVLYSYVSENINEKQGVTYVMYEFYKKIMEEIKIYSNCFSTFILDYMRMQRGSGYMAKANIGKVLDKNYLAIFSLGSVFSPEKMDRLINKALNNSFYYDKSQVDLIRKHLKIVEELKYSAQNKVNDLIDKINWGEEPETFNNENDNKNMTYQDIIEKVQDVLVNRLKEFVYFTMEETFLI